MSATPTHVPCSSRGAMQTSAGSTVVIATSQVAASALPPPLPPWLSGHASSSAAAAAEALGLHHVELRVSSSVTSISFVLLPIGAGLLGTLVAVVSIVSARFLLGR